MLDKYNEMLREEYGSDITVKLIRYIEDDGSELYRFTSARYGDSDNAFETAKEAYYDASVYLNYIGELW